jgi:hypothetical protein
MDFFCVAIDDFVPVGESKGHQGDPAAYRLICLPLFLVWNLPAIIQEG